MGAKTFNNVKINLTLKTTTTRANLSTSSEDLAVQLGKIKKWYDDFAWSAFTAPTVEVTGSGNAITSASWGTSNGKLTLTKGSSFSTVSISRNLTSGTKIGTITINGAATDLYCQTNTDTKVTQTAVGSTYTNYRPLVIGASNSATAGFSPSTVTNTTFTTQAIYCQPSSGTIFATKFDGFLTPKLFTSSTVDSTAGSCFFYGNNLLGNGNYDWIGIQGDSGADKFQLMPFARNMLLYRQNDNGGSSADWQDWISLLAPSSVTANGGITATITTTTIGTDDGAATFNSGVRLSHTNSVTAVTSNSLLKIKYDAQGHITGSTAVAASDLPSHTHPYLPLAGGTMDDTAVIKIPNGSHSSQYTGFGIYHYIGAGNGWARGINVNSATDGTRIGSLGMYGTADATEPLYAYFGKAYNDAWFELYKSFARINDDEENGFQFKYKPSSLSSGYSASFITLFPGDRYGYGIVIGHTHGGLTVVGGGESASGFTDTAFDSTTSPYGSTVFQFDSEELVLTADNSIWFVSGANGLSTSAHTDWTNLKTALFDSSGNFRPSVDNKGSIGTSSYKWASIYGTTIYENGTSLASKYAAIGHTHSSLNVGNVGGKGTPIYFSSGTPTACSVPASGAWWSTSNALVPQISTAGVLEIGKYIDLHATAASTNNFDYRLEAVGTKEIMLSSADTNNVLTLNTAGYNQIGFKTTATNKSYTALGIVSYPLSANGQTMLLQCGGNMVIGGGEFAAAAYARKDSTGETQVGYDNIVATEREKLYLGADTEVQIIANAQNLATYSNNDHVVWKFQTTGQLITPGTITDTLDLQHTMIHQSVRSDSNCVTLAQWIVNGAASTTYRPGISFHNTGGDSTDKGAIILRPYHHNADPWGENVGLYIGKNILKLDGVNVALQNAASLNTMINALGTGSSAPTDADYYVSQYAGGGTTTTTYHRRPVSALYSYIRSKHIKSAIAVQTGSSKKAKITLQTLMTWLITTKKYIPSGTTEDIIIKTTWAYANNDILRFNANGVDYEMSLAGVIIEFKGLATSYNTGEFTFTITSAPAVLSDTPTTGYTRFPANTTAVYHCNGSGYSPTWTVNMNKAVQTLLYSSTSSAGYGYADIVIGAVFSNWTLLLLEFMEASYGYSNENPHSGSGLIPLSLVRSIGAVSDISQQYQIPIGYNPGNPSANQYIAVVYTDDSTFRLSRGGSGGPIGKVKIYGIC